MMVDAQSRNRPDLPPFHFRHQRGQAIRAPMFQRDVTSDFFEHLLPERLNPSRHRPRYVTAAFLKAPVFLFTNGTPCNPQPRVTLEFLQQPFEITFIFAIS